MINQIMTNDLFRAYREAEIMRRHLASSDDSAHIQRMHEQISSSSILKAVAEAKRIQDHFASTSVLSSIARIQQMHEKIALGASAMITEAQKMQTYMASAGMFSVIIEMQKVINLGITSSTIFDAAHRISKITERVKDINFTINPTGTIVGLNATFPLSQVENTISTCINDSNLMVESIPIEIRINNFLTAIARQHPLITKIVVLILLPILINIVTSSNPSMKVGNQTIIINQIKMEVKKLNVDKDFYNNYRFVSTPVLNVWSKDTVKSRIVGKLYLGQLVRVVRKNKNWSLIEYESSDGDVVIDGWVFTRYVKRFD